jgi:hypothetical protein
MLNKNSLKTILFFFKYDFILSPLIFAIIFILIGMSFFYILLNVLILFMLYKSGIPNILMYKLLGINVDEIIKDIETLLKK